MKLKDFGLLTDENLDPDVVAWLRKNGFDVLDVCEQGWQGSTDLQLMQRAFAANRVIVTHDSDFGTLAVLGGQSVVGIVYLRPAHFDSQFTIGSLQAVLTTDPDVSPPFILVAKRSDAAVAIRVRRLS